MFTEEEHIENRKRLGISEYIDLLDEKVYYVKSSYGIHTVEFYDDDSMEYLLKIDNYTFWSNPFKIELC